MKFDMGGTTLAVLGKSTVGSNDDLGTLIFDISKGTL